jgi:poly(3-hydroxybutyrate) depolymerase
MTPTQLRNTQSVRRCGLRVVLVFVAALLSVASNARAQTRPAYFDRPATLRVVGTIPTNGTVPLVIYLPPTGGSASDLENFTHETVGLANYVVLLPEGEPTRAEYADFDRFTTWFDARITADIARARATYPIDPQRIYVVGFSLGGDLGWAMLGLHPERFAGAFLMGTRCGAHVGATAMTLLRGRHTHIAFAIGDHDLDARSHGLRSAQHRVDAARIESRLLVFSGVHQPPDVATLRAGFSFMVSAP